ncbi:hypothetical protein PVAP13_8KG035151 [Panicum virgatum]|uniref:Uncharacterized protein n=1 Tax=Panicum virgatum TaxID=38727 RepID=A0A8T0PH59_PANVG|nr:hypothetical protein PVAP13_8KG035151 [Panicum virgatum]
MDPGVQIRFSPQRAERRQGKGEADPSARGRPRTGAPAREPVWFVRAPSLPPPPDGFAVAVLQSPHRRPPPPPPIPPPPPPPPGGYQLLLLTCRSAAPPSTPLLQLLREAGSISSRCHPEFNAGVAIPSSPPASPSRVHRRRRPVSSTSVSGPRSHPSARWPSPLRRKLPSRLATSSPSSPSLPRKPVIPS